MEIRAPRPHRHPWPRNQPGNPRYSHWHSVTFLQRSIHFSLYRWGRHTRTL